MKPIIADQTLVAKCGLYCGACSRYLKEKCPGCAENHKASWCKLRSCTIEHGYTTCAECKAGVIDNCKEFKSFMAKVFGFVFKSDRRACIERIREIGTEAFAGEMTELRRPSIRRSR